MTSHLLSKSKSGRRRFARRPHVECLERRELLASYSTPEDTPLVVSDPELAGLVVVRRPEHGVVSPTNAGGFAYVPAKDYHGPDRFTYALVTSTTTTNVPGEVQEAIITVTPVNDPPLAQPDEYSTQKNKPLTVAAPGVLKNDKDIDSNELSAVLVVQATHGVVELAKNGSFIYRPAENYTGPDAFTYRASDGNSESSETRVFLHVRSLPDARDDEYAVAQGGVLNVPPRGVLANDKPIEGHGLIASVAPGDESKPKHGTLVLNADGSFTYKPDPHYFGPDSFVYRATDASPALVPGASDTSPIVPPFDVARVFINVRPSPVVRANPDVFETLVNKGLEVLPPGVLRNDFVFYGDPATGANTSAPGILPPNFPLVAKLIAPPQSGKLALRENGSFEYVPAENFAGTVTFTYQAILPVTTNGAPGFAPTDPDTRRTDIATVTIHVKRPEPPPGPIARDDFFTGAANTKLAIRAPGVLANDLPRLPLTPIAANADAPPQRPLIALLVEKPAHGTLVLLSNGSFEYQPDANFVGVDAFKYRVAFPPATDPATGTSATNAEPTLGNIATVTLRIVPALAHNDEYSTLQARPLEIAAPGVLGNDAGGSNEHPLEAVLVTPPLHGKLVLDEKGGFVYEPAATFTGTDIFVYRAVSDLALPEPPATDSAADSEVNPGDRPITAPGNLAIVKIHVRAVRSSVQAYPDKYATPQNTTLTVAAPGVLGNDYALVNHPVEASLAEGPAHGTVAMNKDGSFTYTPAADFVGEDRFVYKATDVTAAATDAAGTTNVSFATVVIRVHDEQRPPTFIPGGNVRTTDESGRQHVAEWATLLALPSSGSLAFSVSTDKPELFLAQPAIDATGQLSYTPAPNVQGTAQVTVALAGDAAGAGTTTFSIEIEKPHPLFNAANACDVTGDRNVLASDALAIINHVNAFGVTSAAAVAEGEAASGMFLDVSKDNVISALDALLVINFLNAGLASGADAPEGEGAAAVDLSLLALMTDEAVENKRKRT